MAVKGNQRVAADYSKKVGFDEMTIVAINPTKEKLEEMLNIPDMKEPVYTGTYTDPGDMKDYAKTTVSIWLQGKVSQALFNVRFSLINKNRTNKSGDNFQYINEVGSTTWAKDENALKDEKYKWFNNRKFWPAIMGEEKLFDFLQKWTNIDTRDLGNEITLERGKLFKGNFGELEDLLRSEYAANTVCGCATVRVVPNTDTNATLPYKEYQGVYDEFLPGSYIRYFQDGVKSRPDYVKKYLDNLTGEYGSKDYYIVAPIRDYNSDENPAVKAIQRTTAVQNGSVPAGNTADIGPNGQPVDDLPF